MWFQQHPKENELFDGWDEEYAAEVHQRPEMFPQVVPGEVIARPSKAEPSVVTQGSTISHSTGVSRSFASTQQNAAGTQGSAAVGGMGESGSSGVSRGLGAILHEEFGMDRSVRRSLRLSPEAGPAGCGRDGLAVDVSSLVAALVAAEVCLCNS